MLLITIKPESVATPHVKDVGKTLKPLERNP
jgi:hypothetical protein